MTIELQRAIPRGQALVLDSSFEVQGFIHWTRACTLVLSDEAYTLIGREGRFIHSPSLTIPAPLVVMLRRYVPTSHREMRYDDIVAKHTILLRDDYTCQYCGKPGDTIDHILPKSRGGKRSWGNSCCACSECNALKRDRTPEEAGMVRPHIPTVLAPHRSAELRDAVIAATTSMTGALV